MKAQHLNPSCPLIPSELWVSPGLSHSSTSRLHVTLNATNPSSVPESALPSPDGVRSDVTSLFPPCLTASQHLPHRDRPFEGLRGGCQAKEVVDWQWTEAVQRRYVEAGALIRRWDGRERCACAKAEATDT